MGGTEAAAATSVEGTLGALEEMRVNRPFLFVIHDTHSKALLFVGKIVDPPSEEPSLTGWQHLCLVPLGIGLSLSRNFPPPPAQA